MGEEKVEQGRPRPVGGSGTAPERMETTEAPRLEQAVPPTPRRRPVPGMPAERRREKEE